MRDDEVSKAGRCAIEAWYTESGASRCGQHRKTEVCSCQGVHDGGERLGHCRDAELIE